MFYGRSVGDGRGTQRKSDRYEQMTKQQELIELKKRELQAKADAEKHKKEMEIMLKKANSSVAMKSTGGRDHTSHIKSSSSSNKQSYNDDDDDDDDDEDIESRKPLRKPVPRTEDRKPTIVPNVFANDGSFLEQFRRMQEEKKKKDQEDEAKKAAVKVKEEPPEEVNEYGTKPTVSVNKPSIKIISAPVRSSSPVHESNQSVPSPNFYHQNVPPPPPPPSRQDRDQDRLYNRGSTHSSIVAAPPPPPPPPPPQQQQQIGGFPSQAVKQLAQQVAFGGEHVEEMARVENQDDPLMWFLYKPNSAEYKRYRELVVQYKNESQNQSFKDNQDTSRIYKVEKRRNHSPSSSSDDDYDDRSKSSSRHSKKRRSRWGPQGDDSNPVSPPHLEQNVNFGPTNSVTPGLGFSSGTSPPGEPSSNGINLHPPGTMSMVPPPFPPPPGLAVGHLPPGVNPNFPPPSMGGPPGVAPWAIKEEIPGSSDQKPFDPVGIGNFPLMSSMDFDLKATAPPMLTKVTRQNPQLLSYAQQAYGTINLDEEQWKQCEEAYKMNLIFQDIARKKAKDQNMEQSGKFKHEYDSDEEIDDGGTWEHKQRMKEMEKTRTWATDLTVKAKGKHHIGDFLPPAELAKFMEKYKAVKEGRQLDASDYQEFKIAESNVGFKMLQKMGWSEGEGLGSTGQGITAPIDKGNAVSEKQGLGQDKPGDLNEDDDEYTAYRKRMMLAYRFRPNPLNNPRRAYY